MWVCPSIGYPLLEGLLSDSVSNPSSINETWVIGILNGISAYTDTQCFTICHAQNVVNALSTKWLQTLLSNSVSSVCRVHIDSYLTKVNGLFHVAALQWATISSCERARSVSVRCPLEQCCVVKSVLKPVTLVYLLFGLIVLYVYR